MVKGKNGPESRNITRLGPTGLITTTTQVSLHPENETRLLSLTVTDTPAQTRAIMLAQAVGRPVLRDRSAWHELQTWLAGAPVEVVIPYAATLAEAIPPLTVRLRRDFRLLLTLVHAHARLHQASRARGTDGAVLATIEDYAVVRALVADLLTESAERSVTSVIRETVAAVAGLTTGDVLDEGVPVTRVAAQLGIDKSSALRRVRGAIARGFLRNLEERRGRPHRLVPGDSLPEDSELLPSPADLERLHGCKPSGNGELSIEEDYPRSAWSTGDADDFAASSPHSVGRTEP